MVKSIFIIIMAAFCLSCNVKDRPEPKQELRIDFRKLRKYVQDTSAYFNPSISKDKHVALMFKYAKDTINDDSLTYRIMAGKMPVMKKQGSFRIIYTNSNDSILGGYYTKSPFYIIVESGKEKGLKRLSKGSFYVRLPQDTTIATVILFEKGRKLKETDVRKIFANL